MTGEVPSRCISATISLLTMVYSVLNHHLRIVCPRISLAYEFRHTLSCHPSGSSCSHAHVGQRKYDRLLSSWLRWFKLHCWWNSTRPSCVCYVLPKTCTIQTLYYPGGLVLRSTQLRNVISCTSSLQYSGDRAFFPSRVCYSVVITK